MRLPTHRDIFHALFQLQIRGSCVCAEYYCQFAIFVCTRTAYPQSFPEPFDRDFDVFSKNFLASAREQHGRPSEALGMLLDGSIGCLQWLYNVFWWFLTAVNLPELHFFPSVALLILPFGYDRERLTKHDNMLDFAKLVFVAMLTVQFDWTVEHPFRGIRNRSTRER
jgi:hypothetical protein